MATICVVCRYHPKEFSSELLDVGEGQDPKKIVLDDTSKRNDEWDDFNHPRQRRALILRELYERCNGDEDSWAGTIVFETPESTEKTLEEKGSDNKDAKGPLDLYRKVHSDGLIDFFSTAWNEWKSLGQTGRDPSCVPFASLLMDDESLEDGTQPRVPPLIPCNVSLPRENCGGNQHHPQRSSKNVMGKVGYYCTDTCTPIIAELVEELTIDATTVSDAVDVAIHRARSSTGSGSDETSENIVVYALCTHPGHHAARDSFGGYCYVNNAALAARLLQERLPTTKEHRTPKIAILDVDYHCGNGTASIFYNDPSVLVVSIHCHPDFEYPFHSGFGDETGGSDAEGCTLHVPLLPGAEWDGTYRTALCEVAGTRIAGFAPDALVLSLGLDTHADDPCSTRRAGFQLRGRSWQASGSGESDYDRMGRAIGDIVVGCFNDNNNNHETNESSRATIPTIVLQEGGYELNAVPSAAADVLLGMAEAMGCGG